MEKLSRLTELVICFYLTFTNKALNSVFITFYQSASSKAVFISKLQVHLF